MRAQGRWLRGLVKRKVALAEKLGKAASSPGLGSPSPYKKGMLGTVMKWSGNHVL